MSPTQRFVVIAAHGQPVQVMVHADDVPANEVAHALLMAASNLVKMGTKRLPTVVEIKARQERNAGAVEQAVA